MHGIYMVTLYRVMQTVILLHPKIGYNNVCKRNVTKSLSSFSDSEVLCQCPQRCGDKVPKEVRRKLITEFYRLGDHALQNEFLMAHIETRAVQRRSSDHKVPGRNQRRVSCKYHIPLVTDAGTPTGSGNHIVS
jgi:hypothetical protein